MNRSTLLATALAFGLALPALADNTFTEDQARQHLLHLGYTNVSQLQKDAHGHWTGTAVKDGKTIPVAVGVKAGGNSAN